MYQQFAVLELSGIGTYRFSVRVRNAASFGNGIGVAQFGERFTNRGPFKSSANTVSPSVLFKCRPKNASRSAESIRQNHQAICKWVLVLQWVNQILLACLSRSPKSVLPARCL